MISSRMPAAGVAWQNMFTRSPSTAEEGGRKARLVTRRMREVEARWFISELWLVRHTRCRAESLGRER